MQESREDYRSLQRYASVFARLRELSSDLRRPADQLHTE